MNDSRLINEAKTHIGLVGCGKWGRFILRDLLSLGCKCSVADLSDPAREEAACAGAEEVVRHISDLSESITGYIVATPATTHYEIVRELLARGRPIYVEKPLTDSIDTSAELARIGTGLLFVMEKWRYHPGIEAMAKIVGSRRYGKLLTLRCRRVQWNQSQTDVSPIWTLLPHDLSIVDHILGQLPSPIWSYVERDDDGTPLSLSARLDGMETTVFIEISSLVPIRERKVTLTFEGGTLMLEDPLAAELLFKAAGSKETDPCLGIPISTEQPLLSELRAFIDYLGGGAPPMTNCARAAQSVALIQQLLDMAT